ncbi:hypothetical protein DESC_600129 [Desulfosarcina cetonica]|uniref:hypothetical protein n=1 Tax=Desulfosarcina cetonica TaxID=90730 RepID=UPI0006D00125|nr:hypothetical protein [Desulfosarcina cetonica]VTR67415.1 hypothetical protein DESC_600129 [Desulfosarcina cetonica]
MKHAVVNHGDDLPGTIALVLGADRVDRCHYFGASPMVSRYVDAFQVATVDPFPADLLRPRADVGNYRWQGIDAG